MSDKDVVDTLLSRKCLPCEGGVDACSLEEARNWLKGLDGWELSAEGKKISRSWKLKNFLQCMQRAIAIGDLAERESHHPDIHLENYRFLRIEIWTHAIGGLSENDFILAAKIDSLMQNSP